MDNNLNTQVLDKLTKTCPCRCITRATIKKAIAEGATTVEEISKKTGACTGSCKGARCKSMIQTLINDFNSNNQ